MYTEHQTTKKKDAGPGQWLTCNLALTVKIVLLQFHQRNSKEINDFISNQHLMQLDIFGITSMIELAVQVMAR
jgi:hypothetical protein